jgi:hypothetical protein
MRTAAPLAQAHHRRKRCTGLPQHSGYFDAPASSKLPIDNAIQIRRSLEALSSRIGDQRGSTSVCIAQTGGRDFEEVTGDGI